MGNLRPGAEIIYESPDGGGTVYARYAGETDRWVVGENASTIGGLSTFRNSRNKALRENQLWHDIRAAAESNPALQEALERAIIIYELSKSNDG